MEQRTPVIERTGASSIEINKVLRNTYLFLGLNLVTSAIVAVFAMSMALPVPRGMLGLVMFFGVMFGLLWAIEKNKDNGLGLLLTFVFTGFLGYMIAPLLSLAMAVNPSYVAMALGGTGLIFFGLSAYALVSRKDMSFLGSAVGAGFIIIFIAFIANFFMQIPALHLALVSALMLVSALLILWQTSNIIHGGERNYISATVSLYISIYNIFSGLLQLLLAFGGDD